MRERETETDRQTDRERDSYRESIKNETERKENESIIDSSNQLAGEQNTNEERNTSP